MGIEPSKYYNEPLGAAWRDVIPRGDKLRPERLGTMVDVRIQLESELRVCGVAPQEKLKTIRITTAHRKVLVLMLAENDSPSSASLRAAAAAVAGPLRLSEAAPALRSMALDEKEDRRTRLHAIESYISLSGASGSPDLKTMLRSRDPIARTAALIAALRTEAPVLAKIARGHLHKEKHPGVAAAVTRRVPSFNMELATVSSPVAPKSPLEGRPRKTKKLVT